MLGASQEPRKEGAAFFESKYEEENESLTDHFRLWNGEEMPRMGLGTWQIPKDKTSEVVYQGIKSGMRMIDCAAVYGNEEQVGEGIRRALAEGIVQRKDLFVVSKLWNTNHGHVQYGLDKTLSDLKLDCLDLYLIHFPIALKFVPIETRYPPDWVHNPDEPNPRVEEDPVSISRTWRDMEAMVIARKTKAIGLSNFNVALIREVLSFAKIPPSVLQVELHPYLSQEILIRFAKVHGIQVFAYSPLGHHSYKDLGLPVPEGGENLMDEKVVKEISKKHSRTERQILLRWALQRGTGVIFKSKQPEHIKQNKQITDFSMTEDEMRKISQLNRNLRFNDPARFGEQKMNTFIPLFD